MVNDGAILTRSSKSRMLARSMLTAVTTNTELGTDWMFSARLVPVTTTSSRAGGAARVVGGGGAGVVGGEAASAAYAAVLTCKAPTEAVRPWLDGARAFAPFASLPRRRIMIAPDEE